ncbi:MAG: hypothetical protein QF666_11845, partial [Alphaproteobacteria bacterium]|nr:hypothetical protein [Alphaproteobacteria bacterium]
MKRLLAFAASATVAALLLMRILPELAADPEERVEPEKAAAPVEMILPDSTAEQAPDMAAALLLPPPPSPARVVAEVPPPLEAKQAPLEAKPASPEAKQPPPEAKQAIRAPQPVAEPPLPAAAKAQTIAKVAPAPEARPLVKAAAQKTQTQAAAPATAELEIPRAPSPIPDDVTPARDHFLSPGPAVEAEGRVLLRILEHGSGPVVEIAWPVSAMQRRALYRLFEACYGMEIAVIDARGRLFSRTGRSGQPWQPNLDRYSGFLRQPSGRLTLDEKDSIAGIRRFHGGLRAADNVRLFPRRLDALLLGGLKALIGDGYASARAIRAHYRRDGDSVLVEGIRLDGRPILGRIDLTSAARHCRSGAWS